MATLFDNSFDHLISPKLIKASYPLVLLLITLFALITVLFGVWVFQYGWLLGLVAFVLVPPIWLLEVSLARMFMEGIFIRFNSVEQLNVCKEREIGR